MVKKYSYDIISLASIIRKYYSKNKVADIHKGQKITRSQCCNSLVDVKGLIGFNFHTSHTNCTDIDVNI